MIQSSTARNGSNAMYEIDAKFFNEDGSLSVETACAAGRKARSHTIAEGATYTLSAVAKTASTFLGAMSRFALVPSRQITK